MNRGIAMLQSDVLCLWYYHCSERQKQRIEIYWMSMKLISVMFANIRISDIYGKAVVDRNPAHHRLTGVASFTYISCGGGCPLADGCLADAVASVWHPQ